jgi:XTP/dITP diphosphohydrolase
MKSSKKPIHLVLATNNKHKVKEISFILKKTGFELKILTLKDYPRMKPVVENKPTIEGNAIKKAREVAKFTGCLALADDTGLFVDALKGAPGVRAARFAGPQCNFDDNCRKMLRLLKNVPPAKRGASFRTIAALATPNGKAVTAEGKVRGRITIEYAGKKGFGYDPIFWVPSHKKTYAEMSPQEKNAISHRARAFQQLPRLLKRVRIYS